jgi:glycerate kinase
MILIALDGYKNYASAKLLGKYISRGIRKSLSDKKVLIDSMSDGGEGTLDKLLENKNAKIANYKDINAIGDLVNVKVGSYIDKNKKFNIFETFQTAGFGYSNPKKYNTLYTSSYGTGSILNKILKKKPDNLIIGLGGSIVSDGGLGLGSALGVKFYNKNGVLLSPKKNYFSCIDLVDVHRIDSLSSQIYKNCKITILSDVNTPLIGTNGQARVFGPQKGASSKDISYIEESILNWNRVLKKTYNRNFNVQYSGAAGGMGAGIAAILNAKIYSGSEFIIKNTKLLSRIKKSQFVVLGEGKFDKTSLLNKGVYALAKVAKKEKKIVFGVFGTIDCSTKIVENLFDYVIDISGLAKKNNIKKDYFEHSKNYFLFKYAGELLANKIKEYE